MERKILRILAWLMFLGVFSLIMTHMLRGFNWLPLTLLLIPSIGLVLCVEKEDLK